MHSLKCQSNWKKSILIVLGVTAPFVTARKLQLPSGIANRQLQGSYYYSPYEEEVSTSAYTPLSSEEKIWFALLVFTIVALDCAIVMLLNAAIWRPKWEERFAAYVDSNENNSEVHTVQGLCRMVEPIKKSVLLGCVTVDDRNIGNTRTNNNNHRLKQTVEYKFLMRYKHDGKTYEKFMKLKSPLHDKIVPKANRSSELYVLSSDPALALLKKHVHSELEQFKYDGIKYREWYINLGLLGGTPGYIWSLVLFIMGCIGSALPLQMLSREIKFDSNVWSRILIVMVANIIVMVTTNMNINNRNKGYPIEFQKYLGLERKSVVREAHYARRQRRRGRRSRQNFEGETSSSNHTRNSSNPSTTNTQSNTASDDIPCENLLGINHHHQPVRLIMTGTVPRGRARSSSIGGSSVASSVSTLMDIKEEDEEEMEEFNGVEVVVGIGGDPLPPRRKQLEP